MSFTSNPGLYRGLSKPFDSDSDADKAIDSFLDEVLELRIKHKIRDVYVIVALASLDKNGKERDVISGAHLGSSLLSEAMTAFAFGKEAKTRAQSIAKTARDGASGDDK